MLKNFLRIVVQYSRSRKPFRKDGKDNDLADERKKTLKKKPLFCLLGKKGGGSRIVATFCFSFATKKYGRKGDFLCGIGSVLLFFLLLQARFPTNIISAAGNLPFNPAFILSFPPRTCFRISDNFMVFPQGFSFGETYFFGKRLRFAI